jgi:hypothetical protein
MSWISDWRDADLAEQARQEQLAAWRAELDAELRDDSYWAAMAAAQLD